MFKAEGLSAADKLLIDELGRDLSHETSCRRNGGGSSQA